MTDLIYLQDMPAVTPGASSMVEARLASVLDTEPDAIVVIDEEARILICNKGCEQLFGFPAAELVGRNVGVLMAEEEHPLQPSHPNTVAGDWTVIGGRRETKGRHRAGTLIPLELAIGLALTPEGRQYICVMRDLRPHKESEQRLAELQAGLLRMGRLLAIEEIGTAVAHEINQPLTALMLYLQSMRRSEEPNRADSVDLHGMIEKALAEAERACAIVRRMRKFAERRPPERKLLDLRPLIDDAIELTMAGNRHRTRLVRNDDPRLPPVPVDPVLFQQIVVNLVRNALEAVSERKGAEIRVTTRRAPGAVELSVEDDGPGIAPEAVANLFHAFSTFKDSGLGLGLAISRTIAQNHGGDIRVDPGGNGRGATFLLTLPMDDAIKTEQTKR